MNSPQPDQPHVSPTFGRDNREKKFTFAMTATESEELHDYAARHQVTPSEVVREALRRLYKAPQGDQESSTNTVTVLRDELFLATSRGLGVSPEVLLQQIIMDALPLWAQKALENQRTLSELRSRLGGSETPS